MTETSGETTPLQSLLHERRDALDIAIRLMRRHLEAATPGGAGQDSLAYRVASGRVQTLEDLRATLDDDTPAPEPARAEPSVFAKLPEGSRIETIFEVRCQGDLNGALRAVLTTRFLRTVTEVTGAQCLVIGHQEAIGPAEETKAGGL